MAEIFDLNVVDDSNTARFPENMQFRTVNNSARALEGLLARAYKDGNTTVAATGAANAFAVTSSRTITSLVDGLVISFKANHSISGATTLNLNAIGAKAIRTPNGTALGASDIISGQRVLVVFDAANDWWQLLAAIGAGGGAPASAEYLVAAANGSLTAERVTTDTATVSWDHTVAAQAKANVVDGSLTSRKLSTSSPAAPLAPVNFILSGSVGGNALTIALKGYDGNDPSASNPVLIPFRSANADFGSINWRAVTGALSLVISSGSTLGSADNTAFRLWIVAFDDGGSVRLGVINCLSGNNIFPLGQFPIASSTAEGGAGGADSAHVFYTGSAVTSKAYTVLGYLTYESGLATAGTWSAEPTRRQNHFPGLPLPGDKIQTVRTMVTATASGTTLIPQDDTIPQNTEGTEAFTQAITPTSAANLLDIEALGVVSATANNDVAWALFQDTTANALAAVAGFAGTNDIVDLILRFCKRADTTSATTFKMRYGGHTAATFRLNGVAGAQIFGGTCTSYLLIEELMA